MPMFFVTLWVKVKLKLAVPRAGLEMPSIFCSTHGPRSMLEVVPALIDCHGHESLTWGRCTLTPTRCSAEESATSTAHATALRKISPIRRMTTPHFTGTGIHRRRPPRPNLRALPGPRSRAEGPPPAGPVGASSRPGHHSPPSLYRHADDGSLRARETRGVPSGCGPDGFGSSLVAGRSSSRSEMNLGLPARLVVSIPSM